MKTTLPSNPLLTGGTYTPAAGTNVARTWARFGYKTPDRAKQRRAYMKLNSGARQVSAQ